MKLRSFEDTLTQGQTAEAWVRLEMEKHGFTCIGTSDTDIPDLEFAEGFFIEVKCKEEMLAYSGWNGFNLRHITSYLGRNTFILFIVPSNGLIYGEWVDTLYTKTPWMVKGEGNNEVIIFNREHMRYDCVQAIQERMGELF